MLQIGLLGQMHEVISLSMQTTNNLKLGLKIGSQMSAVHADAAPLTLFCLLPVIYKS